MLGLPAQRVSDEIRQMIEGKLHACSWWHLQAPPVDQFTGESAELCFEDWLPSLERTATWNDSSEQEKFLQLDRCLRGKAPGVELTAGGRS